MAAEKTDFFGTFLGRLSKEVAGSSVPEDVDPQDALIRALAARGGAAPIDAMLAPPFTSLRSVMTVVEDLVKFGLLEPDFSVLRLTASGMSVARKLGVVPPDDPGHQAA